MIIGNPYKFSIIMKEIKEWNFSESTFCNGVLLLCIDGQLYPNEIVTATLSYEIPTFKNMLKNITINKELFKMEATELFIKMYNLTFSEIENDDSYNITPSSLVDCNCIVLAVSNGEQIRIMASKLEYIISEGIHNLDDIDVSETIISITELYDMIMKFDIILNN